jgi:hypothetical protein
MSDSRGCLFCGSRPLTSAHILSRRLQKMLPAFELGSVYEDEWVDEETLSPRSRTLSIDVSPFDQQVKRLCERCNSDWMNKLEADTAEIVAAMALGHPVTISFQDQVNLSAWMTVVAMLRATQTPGETFFEPADYSAVRYTSVVPPGTTVWAVKAEDRPDVFSRHLRYAIDGDRARLTAYQIGRVLLIVTNDVATPWLVDRLEMIPGAFAQLAPAGELPVEWPPAHGVSNESVIPLTSIHDVE